MILVSYGASGWSYRAGAAGHSAGFEDPAYDVSTWSVGSAPFGIMAPASGPACGNAPIMTNWSSGHNDDMCLRRELGRGRLVGLTLDAFVDDNVAVWLNGIELRNPADGLISEGQIPTLEIPASAVGGTNVLAVRARDRKAVCAFIDVQVSVVRTSSPSLGRLGFG